MSSVMSEAKVSQTTHERTGNKQPPPRWLPVSLLALTTVALTVPAALLWRQKRSLGISKQLSTSPPPVRRNVKGNTQRTGNTLSQNTYFNLKGAAPPPRRTIRAAIAPSPTASSSSAIPRPSGPEKANPLASEGPLASLLDGPLYTLGAFGLATVIVGVGASLGVLGVQRSMGVNNAEEFAARMRQILLERLPWLSRRIHLSDRDEELQYTSASGIHTDQMTNANGGWSWDAAEERLGEAFDRGGVSAWAELAMQELEEEAKIERRKRGL